MKIEFNFDKYTDFELYSEASKLLLNEMLGLPISKFKYDKLFEECEKRAKIIIEIANYTACYNYENYLNKLNNIPTIYNPILTEIELYNIISPFYKNDSKKILINLIANNELISPENLILYKIKGNSMEGFGFFEGDYAIADKNKKPKLNNFVIAHIPNSDEEIYIKKLVKESGKYYLRSGSSLYPDHQLRKDIDKIIGVVLHIVKKVI